MKLVKDVIYTRHELVEYLGYSDYYLRTWVSKGKLIQPYRGFYMLPQSKPPIHLFLDKLLGKTAYRISKEEILDENTVVVYNTNMNANIHYLNMNLRLIRIERLC